MSDAGLITLGCFMLLTYVIYKQQKTISEFSSKLMSHDYRDFVEATKPVPPPRVVIDEEPREDLGHLQDFRVP